MLARDIVEAKMKALRSEAKIENSAWMANRCRTAEIVRALLVCLE